MRNNEFDMLDNALATGTTRRQFLKVLSAGAVGGLLALFRERSAQGDEPLQRDTFATAGGHAVEQFSVVAHGTGIPSSTNSITAVAGDVRADPEGIAPTQRVTRIAWRDSRNAKRAMTLGAYLYQYDFSFNDGQQVITRTANDGQQVIRALAMSCHTIPKLVILRWVKPMCQATSNRSCSRALTMPSIGSSLCTTVIKSLTALELRYP